MKHSTKAVATAYCAMALCLFVSPAGHAQGEGKPLLTGRAHAQPAIMVWVDGSDGPQVDEKAALEFQKLFADTEWAFIDDGRQDSLSLTIRKGSQLLFAVRGTAGQTDQATVVLVHGRSDSADWITVTDGMIAIPSGAAGSAGVLMYFTQFGQAGQTRTIMLVTPLELGTANNTRR